MADMDESEKSRFLEQMQMQSTSQRLDADAFYRAN